MFTDGESFLQKIKKEKEQQNLMSFFHWEMTSQGPSGLEAKERKRWVGPIERGEEMWKYWNKWSAREELQEDWVD